MVYQDLKKKKNLTSQEISGKEKLKKKKKKKK